MNKPFEHYLTESEKTFEGWDFSYITSNGRMKDSPISWDYTDLIQKAIKNSTSLLDMGTGGGEYLSSLSDLPSFTCATEGYEPNVQIAKNRLEPLGIKVFQVIDDNSLPFENDTFDLIINRHEAYSAKEIMRILKPGGVFITQQVGGENDKEFNEWFNVPESEYSYWNLEYALKECDEVGLSIQMAHEDKVYTSFQDVGAIIYYLKAIPWQIPDFSVENYKEQLQKAHDLISKKGPFKSICHRFIITAMKNK